MFNEQMRTADLTLLASAATGKGTRRRKVLRHVLLEDVLVGVVRGLPLRLRGIGVEVIRERLGL